MSPSSALGLRVHVWNTHTLGLLYRYWGSELRRVFMHPGIHLPSAFQLLTSRLSFPSAKSAVRRVPLHQPQR